MVAALPTTPVRVVAVARPRRAAGVTISAPLLATYRRTVAAFREQIRGFVTQRGGTYLTTTTDVPPEEFLLTALRSGGLVK